MAMTGPLAVFYQHDAANGAPDEAVMDRGGMASSSPRLFVMRIIPVASALALLAAAPAAAQTVVGGIEPPEVTVDLSVLDALGPPPTLPELLRGRMPPQPGAAERPAQGRRLALHRPEAKKKAAKTAHKHEKPQLAAHRAAPVKPVAASGGATPREAVTAAPLAETAAPAPSQAAGTPAAPAESAAAAPAETLAVAAPAKPTAPVVPVAAPPSPVPVMPPPSPATVTAMSTPPSLPPASPVKPTPAAVPAAIAATAGDHARVLFGTSATDLPEDAKAELDAVVRRVAGDAHLRLQLVAYAGGAPDQSNQARRMSLQRALAVRSYLMEHGIANTRMDVRALGNHTEGSDPPDRVDIVMLEH